MKNKITYKKIIVAAICICMLAACTKKYITGGTAQNVNAYKNTATYDVLKSIPQFDTLVQLIDAANIKDKINEPGVTLFAPTNTSVFAYLQQRTVLDQNTISQDAQFGLDSLVYYLQNNVNGTADSLLMYIVHQPLTFNVLLNTGTLYTSELPGDSVIVSYEYTKDPLVYDVQNSSGTYQQIVSSIPQVVYFTQLWHPYNLSPSNPADSITADIGIHTLCKTSGIITQTGVMNTLENSHVLFFYGTKQ